MKSMLLGAASALLVACSSAAPRLDCPTVFHTSVKGGASTICYFDAQGVWTQTRPGATPVQKRPANEVVLGGDPAAATAFISSSSSGAQEGGAASVICDRGVAAAYDEQLLFFDVLEDKVYSHQHGFPKAPTSVGLSGDYLAAVRETTVRVWQLPNLRPVLSEDLRDFLRDETEGHGRIQRLRFCLPISHREEGSLECTEILLVGDGDQPTLGWVKVFKQNEKTWFDEVDNDGSLAGEKYTILGCRQLDGRIQIAVQEQLESQDSAKSSSLLVVRQFEPSLESYEDVLRVPYPKGELKADKLNLFSLDLKQFEVRPEFGLAAFVFDERLLVYDGDLLPRGGEPSKEPRTMGGIGSAAILDREYLVVHDGKETQRLAVVDVKDRTPEPESEPEQGSEATLEANTTP